MATSCLTPVISSLLRIWMGCEISASMPGMVRSTSSIRSMSSGAVRAEVHSAFGFSATMMSARSTGMGSVGISALPMRLTTCFTSGKRARSNFSACVVVATICEREVPCAMLISTAKSPSSRLGMNSPPRYLNPTTLTQNRATVAVMMSLFCRKARRSKGAYHCCNLRMIRSAMFSRVFSLRSSTKLLTIGT